mmetsp:Transcript_66195/g.149439  ORF Transcript_66195/g.149439 Transcript_66195/m.149439 type:complete len:249 (-) Transcript_66195:79-825(-)
MIAHTSAHRKTGHIPSGAPPQAFPARQWASRRRSLSDATPAAFDGDAAAASSKRQRGTAPTMGPSTSGRSSTKAVTPRSPQTAALSRFSCVNSTCSRRSPVRRRKPVCSSHVMVRDRPSQRALETMNTFSGPRVATRCRTPASAPATAGVSRYPGPNQPASATASVPTSAPAAPTSPPSLLPPLMTFPKSIPTTALSTCSPRWCHGGAAPAAAVAVVTPCALLAAGGRFHPLASLAAYLSTTLERVPS